MQLHCPRCGNSIPGADLDLAKGVGLCRPCGEIVPFPSESAQTAPPAREYAKPYKPEGLRYDERLEDGVYRASAAPSRLAAVPLLGFAANLADGSSKKLDLGPSDRPGCDYVAASLNDALARAKTRDPSETVPYRG